MHIQVIRKYMGKRSTGPSATKIYKKPAKTKKRLEAKYAMLKEKAAKKK